MLKKLVIELVMVMMMVSGAYALDTDFCNNWQADGWTCIGKLTLEDMGEFNAEGSFNWNGPEAVEFLEWQGGNPVDDPIKQFNVDPGTFSIRHSSDSAYVRIMSSIGEAVMGNTIIKANCINPAFCGEGIGYFIEAEPPEGCDGNGHIEDAQECVDASPELYVDNDGDGLGPEDFYPRNDHPLPCCQVWPNRLDQLAFQPANIVDVAEVRWVEKDIVGFKERRTSDGIFPKYKLYPINFWNFDDAWEEVYEEFLTHFPINVLPEANSVQTVRYTMTDGQIHEFQYRITNVDPMPIVLATKEVDGETKIKIHTKDKKIGLKLTWNDPPFKDIMKPGIQLRVGIGGIQHGPDVYMNQDVPENFERFYWIDCPAQMHKMLIPKENWDAFKNELIALGHWEAYLGIVYRTHEHDTEFGTNYQNRGQSDIIFIPLN